MHLGARRRLVDDHSTQVPMKALNKVVRQVAKTIQTPKTPSRANRRRKPNTRRARQRNSRVARGPSGILAGYGSPLTSMYHSRATPDGCIVSGFDLVTSFPVQDYISYYMPANPLWWQGTRIAAQARGYQNYRPLKFIIHYRPQVGSTSELSLFIGTLWQGNSINLVDSIEPSLVTSPGGVYLPSWNDVMTHVQTGRHLPQRMFPINDKHFSVVPFTVVGRSSSGGPSAPATTFPGRIFIEYSYELRNAIGGQAIIKEPKMIRFPIVTDHGRPWFLYPLGATSAADLGRMMATTIEGTYEGRVMDASDSQLIVPFGINSEFVLQFQRSDTSGEPRFYVQIGSMYYALADSDANWNGDSTIPATTDVDSIDELPYVAMYCTEYPLTRDVNIPAASATAPALIVDEHRTTPARSYVF